MTSQALPLTFNLKLPPIGKYLVILMALSICGIVFYGERLSHEAHRDGFVGTAAEQQAETGRAVMAHIRMAAQLKAEGKSLPANIADEVAAYERAIAPGGDASDLNKIVAGYDSSADYWKLTKDGNLVKDQDGWLRDENGRFIKDKDGNKIGAEGIETGLLNILNEGTKNVPYKKFSDEQITVAQQLMAAAGFQFTETDGIRSRDWTKGNEGKSIRSYSILNATGDTVAAPVFVNGLDTASDNAAFGGPFAEGLASIYVPDRAKQRFGALVDAKQDFYFGTHKLFDAGDYADLKVVDGFQPDSDYKGNGGQHTGLDVRGTVPGGAAGKPVYSLFSGKVVDEKFNTTSSGYSAVIEYGFNFENYFYDTGIQAQYMHFNSESPLKVGNYVDSTTLVGNIGNTGFSKGPHLHYQLMGNYGGASNDPNYSSWSMYNNRRNTFLNFVGSQSVSNYSNKPTNSQNYWSPGSDYLNYYYNSNNLLQRMGINLGK